VPEGRIARLWAELGLRSTLSSEISREVGAARAATVAGTRSIAQGLGGLRQVGQNLTKFVTLPLIGAGGAAVKSAVDFESAFAGVRKTVDATEGQLAELRTGILAMSRELPATKEQIAGVAEAAGQLGVRTGAILGFTRTMIDLGESTNLAAQDAATALARLANITQMPQGQFDRLGSTVVELGNKLASTESEIVEMGLRIAGAGKQIGLSEAQILSFAGALSSVGINAEAGGTSISRVMLTMQKDVLDGGRQLRRFAAVAGMSAGDFSRAFRRDAAGAIIAFIEGLERLRAGGVPVASVLKDLKLGEIRVRDALMRAAGAGDLFTRSMKIGTGVWRENNALTKEAAQRYKTTESRLKILRNRIMAAAIPLGEVLIPAIEQTVGVVAALAEGFAGLPGPVRTAIVALMGVAAASGPILRVAASLARLRAALGLVSLTPIGAALTAFRGAAVAIDGRTRRAWGGHDPVGGGHGWGRGAAHHPGIGG
jgi:TP901 family phage tail tape measure protein